ncbi:hypothetical protein [Nocardia otitidiscaviarum]|uniref:hypothetical protein n=1 Tax=Nocardia otitidiscaviarum TaxID=1823 RepID=UPI0018961A1B|nr:hypothetical protein [Nocardia otitidiscaviarum]MBF6181051.1 hypothetical protein [Nocardia otitidiscaviarum]
MAFLVTIRGRQPCHGAMRVRSGHDADVGGRVSMVCVTVWAMVRVTVRAMYA